MLTLAETEPRFSIVQTAVDNKAGHCSYKVKATQIRELIEAEQYAAAVQVLINSFRTGGYAAATIWCVAGSMYERDTMDLRFESFRFQLDAAIRDLRIIPRGKCGKVNALSYLIGDETDPRAAAKGTMYQVIHKPLLAAARAAFAVSFSGDTCKEDKIMRLESLIENVVSF